MRTWGRIFNQDGTYQWVKVETTPSGDDTPVWVTTLAQVFKGILGESPFYSNYGIPAQQSVLMGIMPDFYMAMTQLQFSQYFASLIIIKIPGHDPHYRVNAITKAGDRIVTRIAS